MRLLQAQGWNWRGCIRGFPFQGAGDVSGNLQTAQGFATLPDRFMFSHGSITPWGSRPLQSGHGIREPYRSRRHATAAGDTRPIPWSVHRYVFGDEHLAGHNPSQGVELCAVVEALYSLEQGLAIRAMSYWPTAWSASPITRCQPRSPMTCGHINTISNPTRSSAVSRQDPLPPMDRMPIYSGSRRTSAAAPPIFTRVGPN